MGVMTPTVPRPSEKRKYVAGPFPSRTLHTLQLPQLPDPGKGILAGHEVVRAQFQVGPRGHELDEAHVPGSVPRDEGERLDLVVILATDEHDIDLERLEAEVLGSFKPGHDAAERVWSPGDRVHPISPQRVQRDVDPIHAGITEQLPLVGQEHRIGGERDVFDLWDLGHHANQSVEVLSDQRLSPGEANPLEAHPGHDPDDVRDLLVAEKALALEPVEPLQWRTVHAPEVALVGDGDTEVLQPGGRTDRSWPVSLPGPGDRNRSGHPLLHAVAKELLLPDRKALLDLLDDESGALVGLGTVGTRDRYGHADITHRQVTDTVHHGDAIGSQHTRGLVRDLRENSGGHLLVRVVAHTPHRAALTVIAYDTDEQETGSILVRSHPSQDLGRIDGVPNNRNERHVSPPPLEGSAPPRRRH